MDGQDVQRLRYLHLLRAAGDDGGSHKAEFRLCGGRRVRGYITSTDSQTYRILVRSLETPSGLYEKAVLRGGDVDLIEIRGADWASSTSGSAG